MSLEIYKRYIKGCGFLCFAKNIGKNISSKYSQKLVDSAKKCATDAIKTASKRAIKKTAEATGDLIGNKCADKITIVSKKSPGELHSKELSSNEAYNEIPKKRYISPQERQQITINFIDDALNQPSKFRAKNWFEINDESRRAYNANSQIKFKPRMLKSSLCDYSDAYVLVKGKITITGAGNNAGARRADERDKGVVFKNFAPFANYKSVIHK